MSLLGVVAPLGKDIRTLTEEVSQDRLTITASSHGAHVFVSWSRERQAASTNRGGDLVALTSAKSTSSTLGGLAERFLYSSARDWSRSLTETESFTSLIAWEAERRTLHLYRSRSGVPPLFYWQNDEITAFSTSIKELLDLGAPRDVDEIALGHYQLTGYVHAPRTMVESIRKVPAGHRTTIGPAVGSTQRFWTPQTTPKQRLDPMRMSHEIEDMLSHSFEKLTKQSERLGILLSGGIDSVGLATIGAKRSKADLRAFTFEYSEYEGVYNEGGTAALVASTLGIPHQVIPVSPEMLVSDYGRLTGQYEQPISYGIHSAWMDPLKRAGVDVAVSGALGTSWAPGRAHRWAHHMSRLTPDIILGPAARIAKRLPRWAHRANTLLSFAAMSESERYLHVPTESLLPDHTASLLRTQHGVIEEARADIVRGLDVTLPKSADLSYADRMALMSLSSFGPDHLLTWSHIWAQEAGIALVYPMMENSFVDYMLKIDNRDPDSPERRLMAARYLPQKLTPSTKIPQTIPLDVWLRGPLQEWSREILNRDEIRADGRLNFTEIERCLEEHASGKNHKWCIWTSLSYLIWKREFLEASPVTR